MFLIKVKKTDNADNDSLMIEGYSLLYSIQVSPVQPEAERA